MSVTAHDMRDAQLEVQKAGTLAEAQAIVDRLAAQEQETADIFYTQQEMIGSLQDLLSIQDRQVTYISPPAPQPKAKNYLIYIAIGIGFLFFTGKLKL